MSPSDDHPAPTGDADAHAVSLPVLPDRLTIRRSRSGPKRAIVLAIVQLLMIAHLVQWAITGSTLTPVEPSESMETVKRGIINAGAIFFVLALLSTLVLGRWFCGWGCHLIMLQDLCRWIMGRFRIRPAPFRSRLLVYVPLILALYMFVAPAAHRWGLIPLDAWLATQLGDAHLVVTSLRGTSGILGFPLPDPGLQPWKAELHLTTTDFWGTFAGVAVAIPFLLVCGFAVVYFLGSKGFCTYGCPYGGFFAPVEQYAPARVRVTDACDQSGHCTAVCTSNVRVHDEVREYGMIVDPGCMKCFDCVSVCPNDALYFGFGRPAVARGKPKNERPKRHYDLTLAEEFGVGALFVGTFLAVRGVYGVVPMLMAVGVAGCVAFLGWKLWRMWRDESVNLHRYRLKYKGAVSRSGLVYIVLTVAVLLLTAHSGAVNAVRFAAGRADDRVTIPRHAVFSLSPLELPAAMRANADRALDLYRLAGPIGDGGIALASHPGLDIRRAWLEACRHDFSEAERLLRANLARHGRDEAVCRDVALLLRMQHRDDEARASYREVIAAEPAYDQLADDLILWLASEGRREEATQLARETMERNRENPEAHLYLMRRLSLLLVEGGQLDEGIDVIRRTIEIVDDNPYSYAALARALFMRGDRDEAQREMQRAIDLEPDAPVLHDEMAGLLDAMGRGPEAASHRERAEALRGR